MPILRTTSKKFFTTKFLLSLLGILVFQFNSFGQSPSDMPLRQVISEAQALIGQGDFAGASPLLDELEVRFED